MNATPQELNDAHDILDTRLEDVEDIKGFDPFKPGTYRAEIEFEYKEINDAPAISLNATVLDVIEINSELDKGITKPGDTASVLFMLNNEFGQAKLKRVLSVFEPLTDADTFRGVLEAVEDINLVCTIVTGVRADKKDSNIQYMTLNSIALDT